MAQMKILVTNGGRHPAWKWADLTTSELIEIADRAEGPLAEAAHALKGSVLQIMTALYDKLMATERAELKKDGSRLAKPLKADTDVIDEAVAALQKAAEDSTLTLADGSALKAFAHYWRDNGPGEAALRGVLDHHFSLAMDVERSWFADENPKHPMAKAFHAARTGHGMRAAHAHISKYLPK
jgi:hypothetical protein